MPLQRFDTQPVPRPSGLIPPVPKLDGVTELRLHGVGGTTPQDLLGDDAPQQVSGDRIAGFYRTADTAGRHVEAYSWGGLTSRSGSRVLWLLLFPFAMANVAGWMCTPRTHASPRLFRLHRTAVRWAALGVTINLLLIVSTTALDLVGYQCGGQDTCANGSWLLRPLRYPLLADYPGRRVLAGALLPIALVALLAVLTLRSIGRYESARPPARVASAAPAPERVAGTGPPPERVADTGPAARDTRRRSVRSAAQPRLGLAGSSFWDGQQSALNLGHLHIGSGCAFVGLAVAHAVHTTGYAAGAPFTMEWLWGAALAFGLAALLGALALTICDTYTDRRPDPALAAQGTAGEDTGGPGPTLKDRAPGLTLVAGIVSLCCAGLFAATQPAFAQPFGFLPGMRGTANVTLAAVLGSLLLVLPVALLGGWRRGQFTAFGPFIALTLSVLSLNVVLLGSMNRIADLLGEVSTRQQPPSAPPSHFQLYLAPMSAKVVQYLTVLPLILILIFVLWELMTYWRSGTDRRALDEIRAWYARQTCPNSERIWQQSTIEDPPVQRPGPGWPGRRTPGFGWERHIARARRLARIPHDADKLLTAMAAIGVVLVVIIQVRYWIFHQLPWTTAWTLTAGSYLATGAPLVLILLLRRGWRNLGSRRRIGILWDITTFWPRAYHPLAPPSYAERAVPELQRRLWRIHDNGGRVVLAAHSQGTILAAAALMQPDSRPVDDEVALVTFGSPLRTLYGWAFPAYFGDEQLRPLAAARNGDTRLAGANSRLNGWRNFYYLTDYIGGPAFTAGQSSEVDRELPDPATCWYVYGQPKPVATRHSGYWADPAVWREVDRFAESLRSTGPPPRPSN